jgi:hypothetical protein
MSSKEMTRRDFLKAMAGSSLFMTLPFSGGCPEWQNFEVPLVKDPDDSYAIKRAIEMIGGLDFLNPGG